jgi:hypothetical protein
MIIESCNSADDVLSGKPASVIFVEFFRSPQAALQPLIKLVVSIVSETSSQSLKNLCVLVREQASG